MEVIRLNREQIENQFANVLFLKDMIAKLEKAFSESNQVICGIKINGMTFSEADEVKFSETKRHDINEIELTLEDKTQLLVDSLQTAAECAANMKSEILAASEKFRFELGADVHKKFAKIMTDVQWFSSALLAIKANIFAQNLNTNEMSSWTMAEKQMVAAVQELVEAYESQDFIRVSDILEYELSTTMDNWVQVLNTKS